MITKKITKKPTKEEQGHSLKEAIARLKTTLSVAQVQNNSQEIMSLTKIIECFERKLNQLKSLK